MSAALTALFGAEPSRRRDPDSALLIGALYLQAGGAFTIDAEGKCHIIRRFERAYPPAEADDQRRVFGMLEGLLSILHPDDKGAVFDAYGEAAVDESGFVATISEPTRRLP